MTMRNTLQLICSNFWEKYQYIYIYIYSYNRCLSEIILKKHHFTLAGRYIYSLIVSFMLIHYKSKFKFLKLNLKVDLMVFLSEFILYHLFFNH